MLSIVVSITEVSPRVMSCGGTMVEVIMGAKALDCPGRWDYANGYYWWGEVMIPVYLVVLLTLQVLCIAWLFDIAKG